MSDLAVLGGTPAISPSNRLALYPKIGSEERKKLEQVLDSTQLWAPWSVMTRGLEDEWSRYVGVSFCRTLSSGTAALHCALSGCDIGPGDEVLVPAYSYIASAAAVLMTGAKPIFIDVLPEGNIDPVQAAKALTDRTKAIVAVHLHGAAADMPAIMELASRHRISVVEDCAQAHGAMVAGRPVGGIGRAGAFSLNATKILAGGEGGLLTTNDPEVFNLSALLHVFSTEYSSEGLRFRGANSLGFNYRTTEFASAFALARLRSFEEERIERVGVALKFIRRLQGIPGLIPPAHVDDGSHVYSMLRFRLDPQALSIDMPVWLFREKVVKALTAEGMNWWIWERRILPEYPVFGIADRLGFPFKVSELEAANDDVSCRKHFPVASSLADDAIFTTAHFPHNGDLSDVYFHAIQKVWDSMEDVIKLPVDKVDIDYQTPF